MRVSEQLVRNSKQAKVNDHFLSTSEETKK